MATQISSTWQFCEFVTFLGWWKNRGPFVTWGVTKVHGLNHRWKSLTCTFSAQKLHTGVEPKIGVFYSPKWMVKIMEIPIKMDDLGGPPLFLETPTPVIFALLLAGSFKPGQVSCQNVVREVGAPPLPLSLLLPVQDAEVQDTSCGIPGTSIGSMWKMSVGQSMWLVYLPTFIVKVKLNVGKYITSPMDFVGLREMRPKIGEKNHHSFWVFRAFRCFFWVEWIETTTYHPESRPPPD